MVVDVPPALLGRLASTAPPVGGGTLIVTLVLLDERGATAPLPAAFGLAPAAGVARTTAVVLVLVLTLVLRSMRVAGGWTTTVLGGAGGASRTMVVFEAGELVGVTTTVVSAGGRRVAK